MRIILAICIAITSINAFGQTWYEPKRGSLTRSALMDAIRPHIEWQLGKPVQFVVTQLRVSRDVAFAILEPQRPGGRGIVLTNTPGFAQGSIEPDLMDGTRIDVLYKKQRKTWVAVHHTIGASDVWYQGKVFCQHYGAVIPEMCNR